MALTGCATNYASENPGTSLNPDEIFLAARVKIVYDKCNHCEYKNNPATGKLEIAHPELPPWSTVIQNQPGVLTLSSGGRPISEITFITRPQKEEGEIPVHLRDGNSVVLIRAKKGKAYHLGYYFSSDSISSDLYYFEDRFDFSAPNEGISYVGDIILDISIAGASSGASLSGYTENVYGGRKSHVEDNERETMSLLRSKFPGLFEKYPYSKLLAQQKDPKQ